MKVLFLTSSMEGGGAERVAALLANAWDARGDDVTLMPTFSQRGTCVYPLSASVHLEFLSDAVGKNAGKIARLRALRAFIRARHPDVILSFLPHVNCAAILAAWGLNVPVIACERTYPPIARHQLPLLYRILPDLIYRRAAALVGQTKPTSAWLRARGGKALVATIANPVTLPLPSSGAGASPDIVPPNRKLALTAGRFVELKRPWLVIDAFAKVAQSRPDWDLAMLGDGPLRSAMQARATALGLADRIFMPGFSADLGGWYRRADLFIMASAFEGFPNALLEAMAHGVACVAFDVPTGPAELGDGGRRLMLLPERNQTSALAEALATLTASDDLRRNYAAAAREVVDIYSESAILSMWDKVFTAVLQQRASSPPKGEFGTADFR